MPVPQFGEFAMFGTDSTFTIQGAVKEGGSTATTSLFSGSNNLIGQSTASLFDEDYVVGTVDPNKTIISSSQQYRGYPLSLSFDFSLKCAFSESKTIPDPIPDPDESGSVVVVEDLNGDGTEVGFDFTTGGGNITGSGGNGDDTFPASSSYDLVRLSCKFREIRALRTSIDFLSLVITTGSDNLGNPDDGLFTSMTLSSSVGEDTLQYCDLYDSGSYGNGLYRYRWWSSNACDHFTNGNGLVVSFDTASVDYFTDCDPALTTTQVTITNTSGEVYQNRQVACDSDTITYKYIESSDLTNGLTIGDTVYNTSDGREEFNGNSKYFGINTSSAPTLNVSPDKIVQISSAGNIINIIDCVPTPYPYTDFTESFTYDCYSSDYEQETYFHTPYNGNVFSTEFDYLTVWQYAGNDRRSGVYKETKVLGTNAVTASFNFHSFPRPNKFTIYDSTTSYENPLYTSGWIGNSLGEYNEPQAPGGQYPTSELNTAPSGSATIHWKSTEGRRVRVDYGIKRGGHGNDQAVWSLVCSGSLQELNVTSGSSATSACIRTNYGEYKKHYHVHNTSSFSTLGVDGYYPPVYQDESGLTPQSGSDIYFSYTSSAKTRYYYTVDRGSLLGRISQHGRCNGILVAGVNLGASGQDCDDNIPTTNDNVTYIASSENVFTLVNDKLKIDNDNLTIAKQAAIKIKATNPPQNTFSTNFDERSVTSATVTVGTSATSNTYLVSSDSLKNPSGTKVLATVTNGTPSKIKFTPCVAGPGGGGCTEFDASYGFYDSSFSGNNPVDAGMCSTSFPGALFIAMSGLIPLVGDSVHTSAACSGAINAPNTYYTIYNSVMNKTFIIKMNADGDEIAQVWECGESNVDTSGDETWYLSAGGENNPLDFCGVGSEDNDWDEYTSDADSWSTGVGEVVYISGGRFNGGNKWYRLSSNNTPQPQPDSYDAPPGGTVEYYWRISTNGVITTKVSATCPS